MAPGLLPKGLNSVKARLKFNSSAGFSLVEATIGLALLAVVCLALYSGLGSTTFSVKLSRENLRATQIMAEKLDTIRLYGWTQLTDGKYIPSTFTKSFYPHDQLPPELQRAHGDMVYEGKISIEPAPVEEVYKNDLRQVTVELKWHSGNMERSRKMSTLVSRYGLHKYIY
jgi:hypothetical protein